MYFNSQHTYTRCNNYQFYRNRNFLDECVTFLTSLAEEIGLSVKVVNIRIRKPIIIITWLGKNPELSSLLLNSHMDVVPVYAVSFTKQSVMTLSGSVSRKI